MQICPLSAAPTDISDLKSALDITVKFGLRSLGALQWEPAAGSEAQAEVNNAEQGLSAPWGQVREKRAVTGPWPGLFRGTWPKGQPGDTETRKGTRNHGNYSDCRFRVLASSASAVSCSFSRFRYLCHLDRSAIRGISRARIHRVRRPAGQCICGSRREPLSRGHASPSVARSQWECHRICRRAPACPDRPSDDEAMNGFRMDFRVEEERVGDGAPARHGVSRWG
jgi:hypothetical protein